MNGPDFGLLASSLAALGIIFLVLIGAAVALRRLRGTGWGAAAQMPIKLIGSRPLGGQNMLVIAEVEGQRFLLGLSRHGIAAIGRLDTHE